MVVTVGATRTPRPLRNRVHEQVSRSTPMVSLRLSLSRYCTICSRRRRAFERTIRQI